MKQVMALTLIAILGMGFLAPNKAQAWLSPTEPAKAYAFKFPKFDGEVYEYETKADSQKEAFERAAQACFDHFKAGRHVSMDYGQDIIDVCVNPRNKI